MRKTTFQYDLVFLAERVGFSFGLELLVRFVSRQNECKESPIRFSEAERKKYREQFKKKLAIQNGVPNVRNEIRNLSFFTLNLLR